MIEDTATSHKELMKGREGTYHYEKLIFGTAKDNRDYLAAVFRWSRGAVQLHWITLTGNAGDGVGFFAVMLFVFAGPLWCAHFGLLLIPSWWLSLAIWGAWLIVTSTIIALMVNDKKYGRLLKYVVLFDNCTYFFNSIPAFFWVLVLPLYFSLTGDIPFDYWYFVLVPGGFLWEIVTVLCSNEVKKWSVFEGRKPEDISILRSQQMYFVTAPLMIMAYYSGTRSAYNIITDNHDASAWSSFGHGGPGLWIVYWMYFMCTCLTSCLVGGCVLLGIDFEGERFIGHGIGMLTACVQLMLIYDPACVIVFGETKALTLKHFYLFFWIALLVLGSIIFSVNYW
jgi:hypothetical protein